MKKYLRKLAPVHSKRRRLAKKIVKRIKTSQNGRPARQSLSYEDWIRKVEPTLFKSSYSFKKTPLISIIVPCYNTPSKYLNPLIRSVISQKYESWELILSDGSTDADRSAAIQNAGDSEARVKYVKLSENKGIVGNTNEGLKQASGEFVAFLDHDDVLSEFALAEVVLAINNNPDADLFYSDEDKLSDDGKVRTLPFFKPDWSPELLLGVNYITHLVVARKSIVDKIGGLRQGFDGAQDYDFLLRITETTQKIVHIPKILYHWRLADGSTAVQPGVKNYADTAGQRALKDAAKRRGIDSKVIEIPERPTNYRLKYGLPKTKPLVSIIIPFKDKVEYLEKCVPSILDKTSYNNYEIILISNNSEEERTFEYLSSIKSNKKCRVLEWNNEFNYSAINNFGRKKAKGEYLIFLNNDTEIVSSDWLEELIGVASQEEIGAVGPILRYPDTRIQQAGIIVGMGGMAGNVFRFLQPTDWTHFGLACWPRNYLAITGACLAVKASKFDEIGGFDEKLTIGGNDVAVGIKLFEAGYRNVLWPFVEVVHYENVSVGPYSSNVPIGDYDRSLVYYRPYHEKGDPYFNSNLDLMNEQIGMKGS